MPMIFFWATVGAAWAAFESPIHPATNYSKRTAPLAMLQARNDYDR